jgi:hypothetical protein
MKTYKIQSATGEKFTIYAALLQRCEETGQILLYSKNDPSYHNIVAVIPASALVFLASFEQPSLPF